VPEVFTKGDQIKYEEGDYRFTDSIFPEVCVGDRVYFTYIVVNKATLVEYEGKFYCNIPYSAILCVVRNGEIIPIGGNVLCEEYFGKDASAFEVHGKQMFGEMSKSGLITSIVKKPSQRHATVKIVGTPLKGDDMEIAPGDIVMFPNKFGFKNNIEGKDYLFIKYWDVHAIVGNENEFLV
jgi:co-chaperonin GroES (HSP10)